MRYPLEIECVRREKCDATYYDSSQTLHRFVYVCSKWPDWKLGFIQRTPIGMDCDGMVEQNARRSSVRVFEHRDKYPWPARKAKRRYSASRVSNRRRKRG